jgi:glycosyltransferase involved in cell wall biosynthesis
MKGDKKLKVILDISTLINHGQDIGAGRYILNLVKGLLAIGKDIRYILFGTYASRQYLHLALDLKKEFANADVDLKLVKAGSGMMKAYERLRFPPLEFMGIKADVLHAMDYWIVPSFNRNVVLTVHDLAFMRFPDSNFKWFIDKYSRMVRKNAARAKRILASSRSTAGDIQEFFGTDPDKIEAVHLAADPVFKKLAPYKVDRALPRSLGIKRPYILSVGTIEPRKDFVTLIKAYSLARDRDPDLGHQLVMAGRTGWKSEASYEAREKSAYTDDIIFTGRLTDEELVQLYNQARLFVYTSVFEGFGLPPLEAMSCGVPVIASDSSSITEVVGDAGIMVQPGNAEGFADSIINTLGDKDLLNRLSERSLLRAKSFSWQETAEKTLAAYRKAASAS